MAVKLLEKAKRLESDVREACQRQSSSSSNGIDTKTFVKQSSMNSMENSPNFLHLYRSWRRNSNSKGRPQLICCNCLHRPTHPEEYFFVDSKSWQADNKVRPSQFPIAFLQHFLGFVKSKNWQCLSSIIHVIFFHDKKSWGSYRLF